MIKQQQKRKKYKQNNKQKKKFQAQWGRDLHVAADYIEQKEMGMAVKTDIFFII